MVMKFEAGGVMRGVKRGLTLVFLLLAMLASGASGLHAQVTTTTVQDTVYRADGTAAGGTVVVSWGAFTTAGGQAVPAGNTSATIASGGVVTLALAPNAGSTPMGSYYTAVFHLDDGTTSREYWVVPVTVPGGGPAKLAAIRNQVLPASVAMQTVSKTYVDNAIAAAASGFPTNSSPYLIKAGDAMSGPLVLPADPVNAKQAADKNYVDVNVGAVAAGIGQKVSAVPSATQTVVQPSGTQLQVNRLNGELYAGQYVNGGGNNGIANALSSPDCGNGCKVKAEPSYSSTEPVNAAAVPTNVQVVDARGGAEEHTAVNPLGVGEVLSAGESIHQVATLSGPQLEALRPGALGVGSYALRLTTDAQAGGSNQYPEEVEHPPYAKSTYGTLSMLGRFNTQGQHVQLGNEVDCYGVGDCLAGSEFITSSGGYRDSADEGAHPWDLSIAEDGHVFAGNCGTGCTTGSTSLGLTGISSNGTQGDGRFLIDKNPAKIISAGSITSGARTIFGTANFNGTNFPVSVFLSMATAATSRPANLPPGTVSLPIVTSGATAGFATSTAALPASSGVACVADPVVGSLELPNYEMAPYSVVDGTHIQLILNKVHAAGATIAVGGLCGYGLEQTVDTMNGLRQLFPVVGSSGPGSLYYADAGTSVVGNTNTYSTSGYQNVSLAVAKVARSGNVTTVTIAGNLPEDVNGLTLTVSGVQDASYDGQFPVTTTGANTLTYPNSGADGSSSGGTLSLLTGGFVLYPMAEVLSVLNPATNQIDGQLTLAPNTVAWAPGDALEEPHYYSQLTYASTEAVIQYVPRPIQFSQAGMLYQGQVGPGFRGWQVTNGVPASNYLGDGGTHQVPDDAYVVAGPWTNDFEIDAGVNAVIRAHCNLHTCNRWNSSYHLFDLDSVSGEDFLTYDPLNRMATWQMQGANFTFAPTGFYANTINVGTLNATTINSAASGDLSGSYSNPVVSAVHAKSGSIDGVSAGSSIPLPTVTANRMTVQGTGTDAQTNYVNINLATTGSSGYGPAFLLDATSMGGHKFTFFSSGPEDVGGAGSFGVFDNTAGVMRLSIDTAGEAAFGGKVTAPSVAAGNGYTGTKTIGSCTLVITAGIITNVTGC